MTKAILRLDFEGLAQSPPVLCAENDAEAQAKRLPLFTSVFAELTAGWELSPSGDGYDLFEKGRAIGRLEIFAAPLDESGDGG